MISVKNLQLSLGGQSILKGISFDLPDADNLVILGRSGSGKTVLMKSILGIFPPDEGDIVVDGINLYKAAKPDIEKVKQRFAMVFQHAALLDSFTVYQNVALPLYERGEKDESQIMAKVLNCLKLVGLEHTLKLYPAQLSGGMRKRIGIARALVYSPDYLIFDEPVSGLDPITASETVYYMTEIIASNTARLITITHDTSTISKLGDKILFVDQGLALYFGDIKDIVNSENELIRKYFSQ